MRRVEQAGVAVHAHHQTIAERSHAPDHGVGFRDGDGIRPSPGRRRDGELHAIGFEAVALDAGGEAVEEEFAVPFDEARLADVAPELECRLVLPGVARDRR